MAAGMAFLHVENTRFSLRLRGHIVARILGDNWWKGEVVDSPKPLEPPPEKADVSQVLKDFGFSSVQASEETYRVNAMLEFLYGMNETIAMSDMERALGGGYLRALFVEAGVGMIANGKPALTNAEVADLLPDRPFRSVTPALNLLLDMKWSPERLGREEYVLKTATHFLQRLSVHGQIGSPRAAAALFAEATRRLQGERASAKDISAVLAVLMDRAHIQVENKVTIHEDGSETLEIRSSDSNTVEAARASDEEVAQFREKVDPQLLKEVHWHLFPLTMADQKQEDVFFAEFLAALALSKEKTEAKAKIGEEGQDAKSKATSGSVTPHSRRSSTHGWPDLDNLSDRERMLKLVLSDALDDKDKSDE